MRNLLRDTNGDGSDDDILACIDMYSRSVSNRMNQSNHHSVNGRSEVSSGLRFFGVILLPSQQFIRV